MSLGVNEESHFRSLATALGREQWLSDPRFSERAARKDHADDLVTELETELAKKTAREWEPLLQSAGVPCARLRSLPEALASEQVKERGFVQTLDDGIAVPTLPFRLGGVSAYAPSCTAPLHNQHGEEISEWLDRREQ